MRGPLACLLRHWTLFLAWGVVCLGGLVPEVRGAHLYLGYGPAGPVIRVSLLTPFLCVQLAGLCGRAGGVKSWESMWKEQEVWRFWVCCFSCSVSHGLAGEHGRAQEGI